MSGKTSEEVTTERRPGGWEGGRQAESLGKSIPGGETRAKSLRWECVSSNRRKPEPVESGGHGEEGGG